MTNKMRSAEISNRFFAKELDDIAEQQQLDPSKKQAILAAANKAKEDAVRQAAYIDDKYFYRGVLIILGAAVIMVAIGGLILAYFRIEVPQFIAALATTAIGAVAGLLAPSPTSGN